MELCEKAIRLDEKNAKAYLLVADMLMDLLGDTLYIMKIDGLNQDLSSIFFPVELKRVEK